MDEERGPYNLMNQQPNDTPADQGVPWWTRAPITAAKFARVQSLAGSLVVIILATHKDTNIRAAANELKKILDEVPR